MKRSFLDLSSLEDLYSGLKILREINRLNMILNLTILYCWQSATKCPSFIQGNLSCKTMKIGGFGHENVIVVVYKALVARLVCLITFLILLYQQYTLKER